MTKWADPWGEKAGGKSNKKKSSQSKEKMEAGKKPTRKERIPKAATGEKGEGGGRKAGLHKRGGEFSPGKYRKVKTAGFSLPLNHTSDAIRKGVIRKTI